MRASVSAGSGLLVLMCMSLLCTAFAQAEQSASTETSSNNGLSTEISSNGVLPNYAQCGGLSGSCGQPGNGPCQDAVWTSPSCPSGFTCQRQSQWYFQCLPNEQSSSPVTEQSGAAGLETSSSSGVLPNYAQCGGKSGTCGMTGQGPCQDAIWTSPVCPTGYSCQRQSEWYYQCLPGGQSFSPSLTNPETSSGGVAPVPPQESSASTSPAGETSGGFGSTAPENSASASPAGEMSSGSSSSATIEQSATSSPATSGPITNTTSNSTAPALGNPIGRRKLLA